MKARSRALSLLLLLVLASPSGLGCLGCGWAARRERDRDRPLRLAAVEEVQVHAVTESRLTATAYVTGSLPDTCTEIHDVRRHRSGRAFEVMLTTRRDVVGECEADPRPFEKAIAIYLEPTDFGQYRVVVNGVSASFYVSSDTLLRQEGLGSDVTPFP